MPSAHRQSSPDHEQAYEVFKSEIMSGVFAPGTKLSIKRLSDAYGFGFTPTRESVRRLGAEGAVEIEPKKAMRIPRLSKKTAADVCRLRLLLEPEMAAHAARNSNAPFIEKLKWLLHDMDRSLKLDSPVEYLRANRDFHFSIYRHADLHLSIPMIEMLWLQMGPLQTYYTNETRRYGPEFHNETVEALATKDSRTARSSLKLDLKSGIDILLPLIPD